MEEELFYNKYRKEACIGRGASAEVWRVTDIQTGVTQALKIYHPALANEEDGQNLMRHEFALMANVSHQNLLRPLFFDIWNNTPFLVLPYCKNGNLSKKRGQFSDEDTWKLLRDVSSGLAYLHKQDPPIIHQDIKPENILIADDGSFYLTDFGVSAHAAATMHLTISEKLTGIVGTMAYMAPEKFIQDKTLNPLSDIWSLGAMAYEMVSGEVPFPMLGRLEGGILQSRGVELPNLPDSVSQDLRETIYRCLELEPEKRPQAATIESTARGALGEKNGPLPPPNPIKLWLKIAAIAFMLCIVIGAAAFFLQSKGEPIPPAPEPITIEKIKEMLKEPATAQKALQMLEDRVKDENADATFLLSRLYFISKTQHENDAEISKMQDVLHLSPDNQKAQELLLKTIKINPNYYKALYELGCDYYAGKYRSDGYEHNNEKANAYFEKALEYAIIAKDSYYIRITKEKISNNDENSNDETPKE